MRLTTSSNRDSRNEKWQFEDELGSNLRRNGGRFDEMTRVSFYTNIKCRIFDNINERSFISEESASKNKNRKNNNTECSIDETNRGCKILSTEESKGKFQERFGKMRK